MVPMKSLEQMRDELADEYIGLRRAGKEAYLAGWDACHALYEEKLKIAEEALGFYSRGDVFFWEEAGHPHGEENGAKAREALEKLSTTKEKE